MLFYTNRCQGSGHPVRIREPVVALEPAGVHVGGLGQDVTMTVTARLDLVIFDAADIATVGTFYAELTGWDGRSTGP
jgi:hypothetical protein